MFNKKHLFLTLSFILITFNLWILSKTSVTDIFQEPLRSLSQIAALLGTVFLGVELILVSRAKWLEKFVGPLDKLFFYHKYLSIFSVIALVVHGMTLILNALPNSALARIYIVPSFSNLTYAAGIVGLYLFVVTVAVSLFVSLPYHIWKMTHRVLALSTLFAAYHVMTISSDISRSLPLRMWIWGILFTGVAMMIYKVFLYALMGRKYRYVISSLEENGDVVTVHMQPNGKSLQFESGQFAYFQFLNPDISKEEHPFSIASRPGDTEIVIAIKKLGDYTKTLEKLRIGDSVIIRGAHGGFGSDLGKYKKEIWIGAGIGVTPFLSLEPKSDTSFYYLTKSTDDAVFADAIYQKASQDTHMQIYHYRSKEQGRFKPELLLLSEQDIRSSCIRICGPKGLLESFKAAFEQYGLPLKQLVYEDFNYLNS